MRLQDPLCVSCLRVAALTAPFALAGGFIFSWPTLSGPILDLRLRDDFDRGTASQEVPHAPEGQAEAEPPEGAAASASGAATAQTSAAPPAAASAPALSTTSSSFTRTSTSHLGIAVPRPSPPAAPVAICLVGERRTLHSLPVSRSMKRNLGPLEPYDVFVVFRYSFRHNSALERAREFDVAKEALLVPIQPVVHLELMPHESSSSIGCEQQENLQRHCLRALSDVEVSRRAQYAWVVKTRPDLLILKRLPSLSMLAGWSPTPAILVPPFSERHFDPAPCMRWSGANRTEYDADYRRCEPETLHMSRHLLSDQFAVMPRHLAGAYLGRRAPAWSYPMPNRPESPPAEGDGLEAWGSCVLEKEINWLIPPGFLGGCECALSVAVRQLGGVQVAFVPFHVALYREGGEIHHGGDFPPKAIAWAEAAEPGG